MLTLATDAGTLVSVAQEFLALFAEWPINIFLVIGIGYAVTSLIFKFVKRSKA